MASCSEKSIVKKITNAPYDQRLKQNLIAFVREELMQKGGMNPSKPVSSKRLQYLKSVNEFREAQENAPKLDDVPAKYDECSPAFYNKHGSFIYLLLAAGTYCIFQKEIVAYYYYLLKLLTENQPMVEKVIESAKEKGLIEQLFWMHGFSAVMDRFTGFIANIANSENKDKYMPKFVRNILNLFCMLYNKHIGLVEAKKRTRHFIYNEIYEEFDNARAFKMSPEDFFSSPTSERIDALGTRRKRKQRKGTRKQINGTRNRKKK